ncbi:MAG: hypothetical protein SGI88_13025 [Candidatus Hydrogenedentes bacterium]|nr:hypothetical protein [Candidatus Hydrogenedentota bacterium]
MTAILNEMKPVATLAMSALMGTLVVLGAVAMLGNSSSAPSISAAPQVLVGISRYHTTDIRVVPVARPIIR